MSSHYDDDDYYAREKKRIAEEAQKERKLHDEDIKKHMTEMIPYYEEAEPEVRRILLLANNILLNRFEEPGMVYWAIFEKNPQEITDYADLFGDDLSPAQRTVLIDFLRCKKDEQETMVDIGFDDLEISDTIDDINEDDTDTETRVDDE